MPRITGSNIADHVAHQRRRVFDAAIGLFLEHGYESVTLGDIAQAVDLARNSLYRYYPSKADILLEWFRTELDDRIERSSELLDTPGDPLDRINGWVDDQLDYAARPEHELVMSMAQVEPTMAADARGELFGVHSRLMGPLHRVLATAGVPETALAATGALVDGLILSAARFEAATTSPDLVVRERLHRAILALITPG